jgi:CubicO group peptidase (beta-lactamase class C family)
MVRKALITLLLSAALSAPALAQNAGTGPLAAELDPLIAEARETAKLTGLALRVEQGGELLYSGAVGARMKKGDAALSPDDLYHVGSIGKSISATAIARLVERDVIGWDDPLVKVAPDFAKQIDPAWHDVTLHELLSHTSGLPRFGIKQLFQGDTIEGAPPEQRQVIMQALLAKAPEGGRARDFAYRNSGYALAALMAETADGRPFETILKDEVADPLGLGSLDFGAPQGEDAPWGHRNLFWIKMAMDPADNADNPMFMSAAGTMHMRLADLATYARAHLTRDPALLQPESYARLHRTVSDSYAYGWSTVDQREWAGGPVLWHNGSNTYWWALLLIAPAKDLVIIFAANDGDVASAEAQAIPIVRQIGDWVETVEEAETATP